MNYKELKTNPLTAHPLADQREWWADDAAIQTVEDIVNHKMIFPSLFPQERPTKIVEGGKAIYPPHGGLTMASTRTKEGISRV